MNDFAPNNGANKSIKQDNSYFGAMKRKFQDATNFIWYLKPEQIQKAAKDRIFREMISGTIDYSENGQYFQDSKFLENLIIAAQDELVNNTTIRDALKFYNCNFPGQLNIIVLLAKYENLVYIYSILLSKLTEYKFTGFIGTLTNIKFILGSYKNLL